MHGGNNNPLASLLLLVPAAITKKGVDRSLAGHRQSRCPYPLALNSQAPSQTRISGQNQVQSEAEQPRAQARRQPTVAAPSPIRIHMSEIISFRQLGLADPLLLALTEVGYERPSPIQAACIPVLLTSKDVLGEAQTGTGKTAAFALPILQKLDCALEAPQALVLTPTRELAIQVAEAFQRYARHMPGFHVLPVYGGQGMASQLRQLKRGAQVIVGTPGRVMDHLERGTLRLDQLRTVVLDEADEMLRMGFVDDVEWILTHVPTERQVVLFSATMPPPIRQVAERHMRDAESVRVPASTVTVDTIEQRYCQVAAEHKLEALTRILEVEEAIDAALVFVRTKTATVEIAERLEARGYAVAALNGDLTQPLRENIVERFRDGRLDIVVATDVAARGLDVSRVSHVINFDIPYDPEAYVHRIGRTGRAGRKGTAILFVTHREARLLSMIERTTRQKVTPMPLPSRGTLTDRRIAQFRQRLDAVLAAEDLSFFREVVSSFASDFDADLQDIAAGLAWMAQEERPLRGEPDPTPDFAHLPRDAGPRDSGDRNRDKRGGRYQRDGKPREYGNRPRQDRGATDAQGSRKSSGGPRHDSGSRDFRGGPKRESGGGDFRGGPRRESGSSDSRGGPKRESGGSNFRGGPRRESGDKAFGDSAKRDANAKRYGGAPKRDAGTQGYGAPTRRDQDTGRHRESASQNVDTRGSGYRGSSEGAPRSTFKAPAGATRGSGYRGFSEGSPRSGYKGSSEGSPRSGFKGSAAGFSRPGKVGASAGPPKGRLRSSPEAGDTGGRAPIRLSKGSASARKPSGTMAKPGFRGKPKGPSRSG